MLCGFFIIFELFFSRGSLAMADKDIDLKNTAQLKNEFENMQEFAKQWTPPLSKKELSILEPQTPQNFNQVVFKRDGTVRGVTCQANAVISTTPNSNEITFGPFGVPPKPYPVCSYGKFQIEGSFFFKKKGFRLNQIRISLRDSNVDTLVNGMYLGTTQIYFEHEEEFKKELKGTMFHGKKIFIASESSPKNTETLSLILGEKMNIYGTEFPPGTHVGVYFDDPNNPVEYQLNIERFEVTGIRPPRGYEVPFQGYLCKGLSLMHKSLNRCKLKDKLVIGEASLPADSYLYLDIHVKKNGVPLPIFVNNADNKERLPGRMLIKDGKLTTEGLEEKTKEMREQGYFGPPYGHNL